MRLHPAALLGALLATFSANSAGAQRFDELKQALGDRVVDGWIYEDIDAGYAEARRTGKPMLVSFR